MRAGSLAAVLCRGAALVAMVVLLGAPAAHASKAPPQHADPLSPLRDFVATVPTTPAPLKSLSDASRARLDGLTAERPHLPTSGLDALRQAAVRPSAPGGR